MATVVVAPAAAEDLRRLVRTHSLPVDTIERVRRSLATLREFPEIGSTLHGRWTEYRFVLGPWRWMLVVYRYEPSIDRVAIVTIQDARSGRAATGRRPQRRDR
jgi:plasmid stabilization system protein ParE